MVWLDGLDLPLVNLWAVGLRRLSERSAAGDAKRGRLSAALCGGRYAAAAPPARELVATIFNYRYDRSREALHDPDPYGASDEWEGYKAALR